MKVQTLILSLLIGAALCAPATKSQKKYPKKFDKDIHSITVKKISPIKSSYATYEYNDGDTDLMRPPPLYNPFRNYDNDWVRLVKAGLPIYLQNEKVPGPVPWILPPKEDSYSDHAGDFMTRMIPPQYREEPEPQSYVFYVADGKIPLAAPVPWSYASVPETVPSPVGSNIDTFLPSENKPPSIVAEKSSMMESSYSTFKEEKSTLESPSKLATKKVKKIR